MAIGGKARWRLAWGLGPLVAGLTLSSAAQAQDCFSNDPADWPPPARPYFMIVVDSSGSMKASVSSAPSCAGYPSTRVGHAKCAVRKTVEAFSEVNFGLAQFAMYMENCTGGCYTNCDVACFASELAETGGSCAGCGPTNGTIVPPGSPNTATYRRRGARILVPLEVDTQTSPSNLGQILGFLDNSCGNQQEITNPAEPDPMYGLTPLNGVLRDMYRYFWQGWTHPDNAVTYPSPLSVGDPACRSINVILLTDGDETCDPTYQSGDPAPAANAANALNSVGVTISGQTFHIPVYVINFIGGNQANTDIIAAAGGTGSSLFATNETELSQAFANIIGDAIAPENCNNVDDNCNGCVDEGYKHYCNRNRTASSNPSNDTQCCSWGNLTQRQTCINNYVATITAGNPDGDKWELPCFTPGSPLDQHLTESDRWLCYDPGDVCDEADNNCDGDTPNASLIDEGALKCNGHCPVSETCNGEDDDCNGIVDEAAGNPNPYSLPNCLPCTPSAEICDGCDNDCDGVADEGITPLTCGTPTPANCAGTISCNGPQPVSTAGACITGGPLNNWGTCTNNPQTEVCDGIDNNCNGQIDEGIPPTACEIPGQPGLVYNDTNPLSICQRGQQPCNGQCSGWVGPKQEICDGLDNDCDGLVDGSDPDLIGVGQICDGVCDKGTTACVNGVLVCQSSIQPQPEVCDGLDNDCNGIVDDGSLLDSPSAAERPCWAIDPSTCASPCSYTGAANTVLWCAPDNAGCHDIGSLATPPCQLGNISCLGGGWVCSGGLPPEGEVCDGVDNDCNNSVDDGIPTTVCGTDEGECESGTQVCVNGSLECQGAVGPVPEICNGLDDDCDGVVDNGIAIGTPCSPEYDTSEYPGPRDKGQCKPGVSECGPTGEVVCTGGVGPTAEVCDGLDNDCDGQVDEVGAAPDGLNGTADPQDSTKVIGETCGNSVGACEPGIWACVNADFVCVGGVAPQPEVCDCKDNDCDGETDEDPAPGSGDPELCSPEKACVAYQNGCQCAGLCGGGEYPCPTGGFVCEAVNYSSTGESAGNRCVIDGCGDCSTKTEVGPGGVVECAPEGTVLDGGVEPPVCVCIQNDCHKPCFGVPCTPPQVCTDYGPNAGKCVEDNCWNVPCPPGNACNFGTCVDNPCQPGLCEADQVCNPSDDFTTYECVGSCAEITCNPGEICQGGTCVETGCAEDCEPGEICSEGSCVPDACEDDSCPNGSYCDPVTGQCGNDPCSGVLCPSDQDCESGECVEGSGGTGGTGGTGGSSGSGGTGGATAGTGGAGGGSDAGVDAPNDEPKGNWGLATGGGGCACETGVGSTRNGLLTGLLMLGIALARRGRRIGNGKGRGGEDADAPRQGSDGGQS